MIKSLKRTGFAVILFLAVYGAGTLGCQYFPSLAQSCGQSSLSTILPLGLMYIAVLLSMIIIPIAVILYLRLTVLIPLSKLFFGNYKLLDSKFFSWLADSK